MSKPSLFRSFPSRLSLLPAVLGVAAACIPGVDKDDPVIPVPPPIVDGRRPPGFALPGPTIKALQPPPPISGGTLLVLSEGKIAFAADPDRDLLYFADLVGERLLATVRLFAADEPGRAVETRDGNVLVVLRRGGAVVEVDAQAHQIVNRVSVCAAPRGIDHDPVTGQTHVACAGGELVTLTPDTLQISRRVLLDGDLRDVVQVGDKLLVSRFRSAEVLVLSAADGRLLERRRPPGSPAGNQMIKTSLDTEPVRSSDPGVAWRMRRGPSGGALMLHQEATNGELSTQPGGYGGGPCRMPIGAAFSEFLPAAGDARTGGHMAGAILPVDFALSRETRKLAIVAAGVDPAVPSAGVRVQLMEAVQDNGQVRGDCVPPTPPTPGPNDPIEFRQPAGRPIAVAFDGRDRVVVQTREPASLEILSNRGGVIALSGDSAEDTGHRVFHMAGQSGLACASCHPEGGEDARTWRFGTIGKRRTQSLLGGVLATAPFHWDGDMPNLGHLMTEVFSGRMAGPTLDTSQVGALGRWLDHLPAAPPATVLNTDAVARGKLVFNDGKVACATCHSGSALTNNTTVAVGTGKALQVPSLRGVRLRPPYMHDGCARTLMDRFSPACGGGDRHGVTSHLTAAQLADLVAFLETL